MSKKIDEILLLKEEYNNFKKEITSIKNNKYKRANTGRMIKELQERCGFTNADFAEIFGVNDRTVNKWHNGDRIPEPDKLLFMACYFDVSPYLLISGGTIMLNNYTEKIIDELCRINEFKHIETIHEFKLEDATTLPHLMLTEEAIKTVKETWMNNFKNTLYAPYVAQVIIKYAYNRMIFKKEFNL